MVDLRAPAKPGQYLACLVTTEEGVKSAAIARAYAHFPIQAFGPDNRATLAFDRENFEMKFSPLLDRIEKTRAAPAFKTYDLFEDPMCQDAEKKRPLGYHAPIVARIGALSRAADPVHSSFIFLCQYAMPDSYFVYGELPDIDIFCAYPFSMMHGDPRTNLGLFSLARLATEPRPVIGAPDAFLHDQDTTGRLPTAEELRLTVYYQIAAGAKGVWYYARNRDEGGYGGNAELEDEIWSINSELRMLRPVLRVGEPMRIVTYCSSPVVTTSAIVAPDKGIALILLNDAHKSYWGDAVKGNSAFTVDTPEHVLVTLAIPEWMKVSRVLRVEGDSATPYPFFRDGQMLRLLLDEVHIVERLLLLP